MRKISFPQLQRLQWEIGKSLKNLGAIVWLRKRYGEAVLQASYKPTNSACNPLFSLPELQLRY